jgi:hypothetical protein
MVIAFALLTNFIAVRFVLALVTIMSGGSMYVSIHVLRRTP